jgi:plastocyanin
VHMGLANGRRRRLAVAGVAVASLLAITAGPLALSGPARAQTAPGAVKVSMKDFAFAPVTITVKAGQTVQWTYDEVSSDPAGCENPLLQLPGAPVSCPGHSTTAVDKGPDAKPLWDSGVHRASGFPYSHTFTTPGKYHYICTVHGGAAKNNPVTNMEGDVVVEAAATTPAPTTPSNAAPPSGPQTPTQVQGERATAGASLANTGGRALLGLALLPLALALVLRRARPRSGGR